MSPDNADPVGRSFSAGVLSNGVSLQYPNSSRSMTTTIQSKHKGEAPLLSSLYFFIPFLIAQQQHGSMSLNFRLRVLDFEGKLVQETLGNVGWVRKIVSELIRQACHEKAAPVITIQLRKYAQLGLYHEILRVNGPEAAPGTVSLSVGNTDDEKYIVEPWDGNDSSFSLSCSFPPPHASTNKTSDGQAANQFSTNGLSYGDYLLLAGANRSAAAEVAATESMPRASKEPEETEVGGQHVDNEDGREKEGQKLKKVKEKRSCESLP